MRNLKKFTGLEIPDTILDERGLLIDSMADLASRYLFGRKVAVFGDPAISSGIARFLCELGMVPSVVCTGVENQEFIEEMEKVAKESDEPVDVLIKSDLRDLETYLLENPVAVSYTHLTLPTKA